MLIGKRERTNAEIPGSSLADIAFLLLIFFLLVTHINVDTGIGLVLPPKPKPNQQPPKIKDRNILDILVNANGQVLINDTETPMSQVEQKVKSFINNKGQDPNLSVSPQKAVVSIKTSRQTTYSVYISMIDKVVGAYKELRNSASEAQFGKKYKELEDGSAAQTKIKDMYPKQISIAKPESSS
jgi:biopolymer transport protein ExbD